MMPVQAQWWWQRQPQPYQQPQQPSKPPKAKKKNKNKQPAQLQPSPEQAGGMNAPTQESTATQSAEETPATSASSDGAPVSANPYHHLAGTAYRTEHESAPTTPTKPAVAQTGTVGKKPAAKTIAEPESWQPSPGYPPLARGDAHVCVVWDDSDSLRDLARATSCTAQQILELNNIHASELQSGQVLLVPDPVASSPLFDPARQAEREVWRGVRGKKRIALTFDAGGDPDGLQSILKTLKELNTSATFFVTGRFVQQNADAVRAIKDQGLPIHNHSWSHPEFTGIPDEQIAQELGKTDEMIRQITGKRSTPYWRPPFGERDGRVLRKTAAEGYQSIYWTVDTLDSVGERKSPDFVVDRVLRDANDPRDHLDGAIVLMHVGEPTTAEALPRLIEGLRSHGYNLVTVDDLLKP